MFELSIIQRNNLGQPTGRRLYIQSEHGSDLADFLNKHTPIIKRRNANTTFKKKVKRKKGKNKSIEEQDDE